MDVLSTPFPIFISFPLEEATGPSHPGRSRKTVLSPAMVTCGPYVSHMHLENVSSSTSRGRQWPGGLGTTVEGVLGLAAILCGAGLFLIVLNCLLCKNFINITYISGDSGAGKYNFSELHSENHQ